jgi:hypothetical protein
MMMSSILSTRCSTVLIPLSVRALTTASTLPRPAAAAAAAAAAAQKPVTATGGTLWNRLRLVRSSPPTFVTSSGLMYRAVSGTVKVLNGVALCTLAYVTVMSHLSEEEDGSKSNSLPVRSHKTKNALTLVGSMPEGEHHHH